jgi:tetratricopeptide (TPR) repeat protein
MSDETVASRRRNEQATALLDQGKGFFRQERYEEAVARFDALVEQFGDDPDSELRKKVALALSNKVAALNLLGRVPESYATHDELVDRFADAAVEAFDDTIREAGEGVDPDWREQRGCPVRRGSSVTTVPV